MKLHPLQFGARENTASPRRHASRLEKSLSSRESVAELEESQDQHEPSARGARDVEVVDLPLTDLTNEATGGKGEEGARPHTTAVSHSVHGNPSARSVANHSVSRQLQWSKNNDDKFEPLLDVAEAANLLRIHPKTLQKLARIGHVPAYRMGRFWRYRASDLEMWLRSGTNSDRQPVDRVDFT